MRVDLVEYTLSKEVEDALISIKELKEISKGTRDFIKNSQLYREIMYSKINFESYEDPCSTIQPKRISQDTLEVLILSKVKNINYEKADCNGFGITTL
ncbi:7699_t:CDS:2, partial [Diversispora eburnea]